MYKAKDKNVCFTTNRLWAISAVLISAVFDMMLTTEFNIYKHSSLCSYPAMLQLMTHGRKQADVDVTEAKKRQRLYCSGVFNCEKLGICKPC